MTKYEISILSATGAVLLVGASMFGAGVVFGGGKLLSHEEAPPPFMLGMMPVEQYPKKPLPPQRMNVSTFPDAGVTWRNRFPNIEPVPMGSFAAYYLNTENSSSWTTLKRHTSASVDMNFAWAFDVGLGKEAGTGSGASASRVASEDFGAYWIGSFTLPSEQKLDLHVTQSWAHTRVIIDGKEVYNKDNQDVGAAVPLLISAGTHTMEVEYTNNWHTTSISVSLLDAALAPKSQTEISKLLPAGAPQWTASVYESASQDKSIKLKSVLGAEKGPIVLNLSSYDSVNWDISGMGVPVSVIVISGFARGSRVLNVPPGTSVYYSSESGYGNSNYDEQARYGFVTNYAARELTFPAKN